MSLGEIQSTFATLIVAGSEATATTLLGAFYKSATHASIQKNLYTELRKRSDSLDAITVESTKDIEYLDAIIHETLRLCYAVPGGFSRTVPNGSDAYAGNFVPGGTSISIRPNILLRSAKYFANPHSFVPERWLLASQRPQAYLNDKLSASQPFRVGPTTCIGMALAWAEIRVLIAKMMWGFKLGMIEGSGDGRGFRWEDQNMMMGVEKIDLWLCVSERGN